MLFFNIEPLAAMVECLQLGLLSGQPDVRLVLAEVGHQSTPELTVGQMHVILLGNEAGGVVAQIGAEEPPKLLGCFWWLVGPLFEGRDCQLVQGFGYFIWPHVSHYVFLLSWIKRDYSKKGFFSNIDYESAYLRPSLPAVVEVFCL